MTKIVPSYRLRGPYRRVGGHSWVARLPFEFEEDGDTAEAARSQWQLLEDGVPLGPAHAPHKEIEQKGGGRYSHWFIQLYFSTSNNTDPNTNERKYEFSWRGKGNKEWLAKLAPATSNKIYPFGERGDVQQCSGVIAIVGSSFCGSTLLNAVLGAHPLIFGGGEMTNLLIADRGICAVCGSNCLYWTERAVRELTPKNLYDRASRIFGRPIVADSSKQPFFFESSLPTADDLVSVKLLIVKHPLRHVASMLEKKDSVGDMPGGSRYRNWEDSLYGLRHFYETLSLPDEKFFEGKYNRTQGRFPIDILIRYEDFVTSPAKALRPVLTRFGLRYASRMDSWATTEHHFIGGNVGPRVQIAHDRPVIATAERKYRQRGIFLDNSYSEILNPDAIKKILTHPDAIWMCDRFGYNYGLSRAGRPAIQSSDIVFEG